MPQIIPAAIAAFSAVKATVAALGAVKVLGVSLATMGKVAMWTALGASMLMKPPGLPSAVHQVSLQPAGTDSALPIIFGRTLTPGFITYREAYRDNVHNTDKAMNLGFENVVSVGPVHSISGYRITNNLIYFDRDPTRRGSATGLSMCTGVQNFDRGSKVFKDGVRVAYTLGEHNDNRTFRQITGDMYAPNITSQHTMPGLARTVQVYQFDGSKNHRFPMGFPDKAGAVIVEGILCYDPRKDSTYPGGSGPQRWNDQNTWAYSQNPYICALTYLLGQKGTTGQRMWGIGADINDIDLPAFVYGANIADHNNWVVGGQVMTDDGPDAILSNLLVAGGGQLVHGSLISCYVNAPKTSIFTIKQNMLVGQQVIRATRPLSQRSNRIVVKYREPASDYNIVSGADVTAEEWVIADGDTYTTETTFSLIQNGTQAHQIGAYELVNSREYEVDITTNTETFHLQVGDAVDLDFPVGAIEGQQFIVKAWSFNASTHTIDLTLISETIGKHEFALGQTHVAPSPARPKSFESLNPLAPTGWVIEANQIKAETTPAIPADPDTETPETPAIEGQATPAFVISRDGGAGDTISKIIVEARLYNEDRPLDPETNEPIDNDWVIFGEFEPDLERLVIQNIEAKTSYDLAISYRSNLHVLSPRQRILNVESGSSSFDWNDDVISNLPPALSDMTGGKIKAEFIALENEAHETLQDALDDVDRKITEMSNSISGFETDVNTKVNDLTTSVDNAWNIIGKTETDGLRHKVLVLEQQGPDGQLALRVEALETKSGDAEAGILSLQQAQTTLENGLATKASASDLNSLKARVTTTEGDITATNNRVSTVETDVAGKASASEVNNLKAEVTTARNGKASLNAELQGMRTATATLETGKASVTEVDSLRTRVDTQDGTIAGYNTRISNVESGLDGKTNVSDYNSLRTEVTNARNGKTNLAAELSGMRQVSTDLQTGKANASDVNSLKLRVDGQDGTIGGLVTRVTNVEGDVAGKASASDFNSLRTEVTNARNGKANLAAELTTMRQVSTDLQNGKASASEVSQLRSTVDGYDARITVAQSTAADALGQVQSKYGVVLNAQNKITGFQISATQNSSTFDIMADKLRITDGTNTSVPFSYAGGILTAGDLHLKGSININNRFIVNGAGDIELYSANSGPRTRLTSQRYEVYDANRLRVRIGIW
nr:hypothetical protein [Brevundimonas naejangsanensis]